MTGQPSPVILVLASGRGERFTASGGTMHKLQAPLMGRTVLARTLDAVRASGLPWHLEDRAHPGMGDSIAAAVQATEQAPGWLVLPADLPLVRPQTLRAVADALRLAQQKGLTVVQPSYAGQGGHPVAFGAACGAALSALRGPQGAAAVLRAEQAAARVHVLAVQDVGVITDIDTTADLERAQQLWRECRAQDAKPS